MHRASVPLDDDIVRGLVYLIGTDSHHRLLRHLRTDARLNTSARRLAGWWDEHPHPLTDPPSP
ncbi:hypothetical protein ILP97_06205 [Amycolatopsis sp. H6(2020)]|nr:hypothetical protein [Amycolatopsis sp. H6(2020)]